MHFRLTLRLPRASVCMYVCLSCVAAASAAYSANIRSLAVLCARVNIEQILSIRTVRLSIMHEKLSMSLTPADAAEPSRSSCHRCCCCQTVCLVQARSTMTPRGVGNVGVRGHTGLVWGRRTYYKTQLDFDAKVFNRLPCPVLEREIDRETERMCHKLTLYVNAIN